MTGLLSHLEHEIVGPELTQLDKSHPNAVAPRSPGISRPKEGLAGTMSDLEVVTIINCNLFNKQAREREL
jgi:hypothetical protein